MSELLISFFTRQSLVVLLVTAGMAFEVFGCIGLVRMPDVYTRLQAATKCVTMGTFLTLVGVAVYYGFNSSALRVLVCAGFVLLTSPVGAHALARGAHIFGIKPLNAVVDRYAERSKE